MINIKDIQVGDYLLVNRDVCIKKGTIVEVRGIDADNRFENHTGCASCHPLDDNQFDGGIWCDFLDPIPLTGEILLKNGFKHDGMCSWEWEDIHYDGYNRIRKYIKVTPPDPDNVWWSKEDSGFIVCAGWREINLENLQDVSLHRLQHALMDCNVDKEIEL